MKYFVAFAILLVAAIAIISTPSKKELEYVFSSSKNYVELKKIYKKELDKEYKEETHKKLIDVLIKTKDKDTFFEASKYFTLNKDKELALKLIDYSLFVENKNEYLKWLNSAYDATKDAVYLQKRADFFSFNKNLSAQKAELERIYKLTNSIDSLKVLYAVGERKFAINEMLKNINTLTNEQKIELFYYLSWDNRLEDAYKFYNKELAQISDEKLDKTAISLAYYFNDYEGLLKIFAKLYNEQKNIEYLKNMAAIYENLFMIDKAIETNEKLYFITKDKNYLEQAYNLAFNLNKTEVAEKIKEREIFDFKDENELISYVIYLIDKNKQNQAEALLKKYIQKNPNSLEARNALAYYYVMNDRYNDAKALFYGFEPSRLNDKELFYFTLGKYYDERDKDYIVLFAQKTKNYEYLKKPLNYIANKNGLKDALKFFETSTKEKINTNTVGIYLGLLPLNDMLKESDYFIKTSLDVNLLNALGKYLMSNNQLQKAKEAFLAALSLDENDMVAIKNLGKLELWSSNLKSSKEYFAKYIEKNPNDIESRFYIAEILYSENKKQEAIKNYKFVLENLNPNGFEQNAMFVKSYARVYGIIKAKEAYKALIASSNDDSIYTDYIEALLNEKQYGELAKEFKNYDYKNSKNHRLSLLYAHYKAEIGDKKDAKAILNTIASQYGALSSSSSSLFGDTAYAYEKAGASIEALNFYNEALKLDPNNQNYIAARDRLKAALGSFAALEFDSQNGNVYKGVRVELADAIGRFGLSYLNNTNGNLYRAYYSDIEKKEYLVELGNRHFKAFYGDFIRAQFETTPFQPNQTAASEKMQVTSPSLKIAGTYNDDLSYSLKYGTVYYTNNNGNVANGYIIDASVEYLINSSFVYRVASYTNNFYSINYSKTAYGLQSVAFVDNTINYVLPLYRNNATMIFGGGVSVGYGKARPIGSIGLGVLNNFFITYGLARDVSTNQVVQNLKIELKYNF